MKKQKIRVGFIGCGSHSGKRLYPALQIAGLELVAVCDLDDQRAGIRAAEYKVGAYTDYRKMCQKEQMDAVLVSIGPQAHYELSIALVELGFHVWTEKPPSGTAAQADEVVGAAEQAGRIVQTGFNYRYTTGIQQARKLIASAQFASPAMVAVRWWLGDSNLQKFMHHYVVHAADLLSYVNDSKLELTHTEYRNYEDAHYYLVNFRTEEGRIAVLEATSNMSLVDYWCRVDWLSKDGMLSVCDFTKVTHHAVTRWTKADSEGYPEPEGRRVWATEPLIGRGSFVEEWGYVTELDRFRSAVLGKREPEATIADAARAMHVCERLMDVAATATDGE